MRRTDDARAARIAHTHRVAAGNHRWLRIERSQRTTQAVDQPPFAVVHD